MGDHVNSKSTLWASVLALMNQHYGGENLQRFAKDADIGIATVQRIKEQQTSIGLNVLDKISALQHIGLAAAGARLRLTTSPPCARFPTESASYMIGSCWPPKPMRASRTHPLLIGSSTMAELITERNGQWLVGTQSFDSRQAAELYLQSRHAAPSITAWGAVKLLPWYVKALGILLVASAIATLTRPNPAQINRIEQARTDAAMARAEKSRC